MELGNHPPFPETLDADMDQLSQRILQKLTPGSRLVLGLCGAPGAGKSTFAEQLAAGLGGDNAVVVPMDGFHLGHDVIKDSPKLHRKGAIDTFDVSGYRSLLQRIRAREEDVVYAPAYRRGLEEPIAASIAVPKDVPVVITEGNYLLAPELAWLAVRAELDEVWFLETPDELRLKRLVDRHVRFGKALSQAVEWVRGTDEPNAEFIRTTRNSADLIIRLG
ncbi:nucleoside/nucleotide kinase family protein [Arthrobacter sp. ISL-48]|uniref:nucleoside/nucleotide kinase family protein n=1 Tax=Arthrobacter sp. ISL-48 TaxID=2819110 RepID=UPI002034CA3B|nr:nucleoside/nucleotide kinase family protein [Arthrobacter sp. ISL-48]